MFAFSNIVAVTLDAKSGALNTRFRATAQKKAHARSHGYYATWRSRYLFEYDDTRAQARYAARMREAAMAHAALDIRGIRALRRCLLAAMLNNLFF